MRCSLRFHRRNRTHLKIGPQKEGAVTSTTASEAGEVERVTRKPTIPTSVSVAGLLAGSLLHFLAHKKSLTETVTRPVQGGHSCRLRLNNGRAYGRRNSEPDLSSPRMDSQASFSPSWHRFSMNPNFIFCNYVLLIDASFFMVFFLGITPMLSDSLGTSEWSTSEGHQQQQQQQQQKQHQNHQANVWSSTSVTSSGGSVGESTSNGAVMYNAQATKNAMVGSTSAAMVAFRPNNMGGR